MEKHPRRNRRALWAALLLAMPIGWWGLGDAHAALPGACGHVYEKVSTSSTRITFTTDCTTAADCTKGYYEELSSTTIGAGIEASAFACVRNIPNVCGFVYTKFSNVSTRQTLTNDCTNSSQCPGFDSGPNNTTIQGLEVAYYACLRNLP
jgi:hypothetical protein